MLFFAGDGPYRKRSGSFQWNAIPTIFRSQQWRRAAFGYFGHMWEVYTFWGFLPLILELYARRHNVSLNIPLLSFFIIASGCLSSIAGGYLSQKSGSAKIAFIALLISCCCCFLSGLFFLLPVAIFLLLLFVWGLTVATDSPQFSTLVAQYAPENFKGTALTIYNSIGFLIAVISLQVMDRVFHSEGFFGGTNSFLLLGIGPLIGLLFFYKQLKKQ